MAKSTTEASSRSMHQTQGLLENINCNETVIILIKVLSQIVNLVLRKGPQLMKGMLKVPQGKLLDIFDIILSAYHLGRFPRSLLNN
jgi:hypothetical protein